MTELKLMLNGVVVDDGDEWIYNWFGDPYVSPKKVHDFLAQAGGEDIQVLINSVGGSVFAGSEIYTALKSYSGRVDVIVSGLAASIASIIMLAGDSVKASPIAEIMIHNASMVSRGDHHQLQHDSESVEGTSLSLASVYAKKTGQSEEEIKALMDKESWFNAEKALELGLIDGILFDEAVSHQMVASAGHIVPKEKIAEFKALMAKKEASQENPKESMQAIVEQMLDAKLARQEEKLASMMDEKLKNFTPRQDEKKAASPFGKFT